MATKLLDVQLQEYWQLLEKDEKQSIIAFMKLFLKNKVAHEQISIKQYNNELDEALARVKNGAYITQEDALKQAEGW